MTRNFVIAALLAATAFTPALAQDTPRERGPRAEGRSNGAGQGRAEGGWQRPEQAQAPATQTQAPVPAQQAAPAPQRWNRSEGGTAPNREARTLPNDAVRVQGNPNGQRTWNRQVPPVNVAPGTIETPRQAQGQPRRNWQNGEGRRDTWRDNNGNTTNGGTVVQRQDDRRWTDSRRDDNRRNDGQWNSGRNDTWRNNDRNNGRYDQRTNWQNQYRNWNRNWCRDWRRDQRYDWQRYRYDNRNLFQSQRYYAPYGWNRGYQRFSIGFTLSNILFDQQYWIDDPYSYRLPPVYGPYRWVRYFDDVLLVDLRTGQVVDTIYDFFW